MSVRVIDPLSDPRWDRFLERHPEASVFHGRGWLRALRLTYGYGPFALTTAAPAEELSNGLVACRIESALTGRRLVSLPFSDHCEVLSAQSADTGELLKELERQAGQCGAEYAAIRPMRGLPASGHSFRASGSFWLHVLSLAPSRDELFRSFHKDCIQRKIRRAERDGLECQSGRSATLLRDFYGQLIITRRRHLLVPQPLAWFQNLIDCLGDNLTIKVAYKDGTPVAAILTLKFQDKAVYKYGCSDMRYSKHGGFHMVMWEAIKEAKAEGLSTFDMGRSDTDQDGLVEFKDRWGAARTSLCYWRFPAHQPAGFRGVLTSLGARRLIARLPDSMLVKAGALLYRHIG
jgi:hypothetical protein